MGKVIVDRLKKEFDIRDEWKSFEIHPETPEEGVLLSQRFGAEGLKRMAETLTRSGSAYGIEFAELELLSNSRMALEASEYAKDKGKFDEFHEAVFYAYFTKRRDIGNIDTLLEIAKEISFDTEDLRLALMEGRYSERLRETTRNAEIEGINSTPTFVINDEYRIVGAQPIEIFRRALRDMDTTSSR